MFTPPPSPLPPAARPAQDDISPLPSPSPPSTPEKSQHFYSPPTSPPPSPREIKRSIGRRIACSVIMVPCILALITLSTHYIAHPAVLDLLGDPPDRWQNFSLTASEWSLHKRHPDTAAAKSLSSLIAAASNAPTPTTAVQSTTLPTVPAQPPILPTPFPQAFDSDIGRNYSTTSCSAFFVNMTNTAPFRSCRPFSLLLQTSAQFINAQTDLTLMNTLIWGTCNADLDEATCVTNMNWFANTLKSSCSEELSEQNAMVLDTLESLQAYKVMRDAACLQDQSANTYCYMDAVFNSNPSDLYFYNLAIGIPLPNNTSPTCSACTKSIMALYATALNDAYGTTASSSGDVDDNGPLFGLKRTYGLSAALAQQKCGNAYAPTVAASTANSAARLAASMDLSMLIPFLLAIFAWRNLSI